MLKKIFKHYNNFNKKESENFFKQTIVSFSFYFKINKITKFSNYFLTKKNRVSFAVKNIVNIKNFKQINKIDIYSKKKKQNELFTNNKLLLFYRW